MFEQLPRTITAFLGINPYYREPQQVKTDEFVFNNKYLSMPLKDFAKVIKNEITDGVPYNKIAFKYGVSQTKVYGVVQKYFPWARDKRRNQQNKELNKILKAWKKYGKLSIALERLGIPYTKGHHKAARWALKQDKTVKQINKEYQDENLQT